MSDDQPFVDNWPQFEEAYSKFPVLVEARVKLARKFNRNLPKEIEVELAWKEHTGKRSRP